MYWRERESVTGASLSPHFWHLVPREGDASNAPSGGALAVAIFDVPKCYALLVKKRLVKERPEGPEDIVQPEPEVATQSAVDRTAGIIGVRKTPLLRLNDTTPTAKKRFVWACCDTKFQDYLDLMVPAATKTPWA